MDFFLLEERSKNDGVEERHFSVGSVESMDSEE